MNSGAPRTGELQHVRGGAICASIHSGSLLTNAAVALTTLGGRSGAAICSGGHYLIDPGAGRLNWAAPILTVTSGQPVTFYDASTITISGVSVSGCRIIGRMPGTAGQTLGSGENGQPNMLFRYEFDSPYTSGLCVSAQSGSPGFIFNYTPEVPVGALQ